MSVDLNDLVKESVFPALAAQVLAAITTEQRNTILAKAIADALKDYSFKSAVQEAVVAAASKEAAKVLAEPKWASNIEYAVTSAIEDFSKHIRASLCDALTEAVCGRDGAGSYSNGPGLLLKHMREREKK